MPKENVMRSSSGIIILCGVLSITSLCSVVFAAPQAISKSDETIARNAALANLRGKILALKLTPSLTVADFANTNPETQQAVSKWVASIKKRGAVSGDNGTVTVTVAVSIKAIRIRLSDIYGSYYDGKKIRPGDIDNLAGTNNCKEVRATGTNRTVAAAAGEKTPDVPTPITTTTPPAKDHAGMPDVAEPAQKAPVVVVAMSENCWTQDLLPQHADRAKLMAELAAKKNALARLGERLRDVKIGSKLTVNDFVVNSNQPDVDMSEFMRAATRTQMTLRSDMLVCEIRMQAELKPAIAIFKSWADENYKGDMADIQLLRDYVEKQKPEIINEIGVGVIEPKYVKERFVSQQKQLVEFAANPPRWISETILVTGEAAIDDKSKPLSVAKTDAITAAKADAEKKLAGKLAALKITGKSSVGDLATKSHDFAEKLKNLENTENPENFEKKVQMIDDPQLTKDKIVRVTVSIRLKPLWDMVLFCRQNTTLP